MGKKIIPRPPGDNNIFGFARAEVLKHGAECKNNYNILPCLGGSKKSLRYINAGNSIALILVLYGCRRTSKKLLNAQELALPAGSFLEVSAVGNLSRGGNIRGAFVRVVRLRLRE